jgi:hypothetical protein
VDSQEDSKGTVEVRLRFGVTATRQAEEGIVSQGLSPRLTRVACGHGGMCRDSRMHLRRLSAWCTTRSNRWELFGTRSRTRVSEWFHPTTEVVRPAKGGRFSDSGGRIGWASASSPGFEPCAPVDTASCRSRSGQTRSPIP